MTRPAAAAMVAVVSASLGCGLDGEWVDLAVAASTEAAVTEVLQTHPDVTRSAVPVVTQANATSTLARQLAEGAPADVFLAADPSWADVVATSRPVLDRIDLLGNTLVEVQAPGGRPCTALADPDHVPAGRYVRAALEARNDWPPDDLVPFPSGPAAAWAVANGDCAHGYVYGTDARAAGLQPVSTLDVRATYPLLLLHERGRPLFEALGSSAAYEVYERHGFRRP